MNGAATYSRFIRRYLTVIAVAAGAMPAALALGKVPVMNSDFDATVAVATTFGSLSVIAMFFYFRHDLARLIFWEHLGTDQPRRWVKRTFSLAPIIFSLLGIVFLFGYYWSFNKHSIDMHTHPERSYIGSDLVIPSLFFYAFGFLCMVASLSFMAVREYLQDFLRIDDMELVLRRFSARSDDLGSRSGPVT